MKTLSFYPSYDFSSHDLNLSLVENSNILYSYEESKLSKTLHREAKFFPDRTILNCFNTLKILPKEIDQVCIVGGKNSKLIKPFLWNIEKYFGLNKKMIICDHHKAHTSLSVFTSNFKECLYWTLDAGGENNKYGEFGVYENKEIKTLDRLSSASLPTFYYHLTGAAGFSDFEEGKLMGLSGYGDIKKNLLKKFEQLFKSDKNENIIYNSGSSFSYPLVNFDKYNPDLHRPYRIFQYLNRNISVKLKKITEGYLPHDIARTGQYFCEKKITEILEKKIKKYKIEHNNICLSGGIFLNILINKKIKEHFNFNIFVPPSPNDMGLSAGGGLYSNYSNSRNKFYKSRKKNFNPYTGPGFNNLEILKEIKKFNLNYKKVKPKSLVASAAKDILSGNIIGWFQGRAEMGPRALGARSVLADPRKLESKIIVNSYLKKRDWFMPYAPSILYEDAKKIIKNFQDSPYMNIAFKINNKFESKIPCALHVDKTMRPQVVKDKKSIYYKLLKEVKKKIGIGCVLNTSFNKHGLPIVSSPRDALIHLMEGTVQKLYIGDYIINGTKLRNKSSKRYNLKENVLKSDIRYDYLFNLKKNKELKNIKLIKKRYKI